MGPVVSTVLLAMAPISELRGAIPLALAHFGMSWPKAYFLSVAGNIIPIIFILPFLESLQRWLRRFPLADKFITWWFGHVRRRSRLVERYGALGLVLFVAIPLPVTGAWTGSIAAWLFGIRFRFAFPAIVLGVLIAGVLVTLASLGFIKIF